MESQWNQKKVSKRSAPWVRKSVGLWGVLRPDQGAKILIKTGNGGIEKKKDSAFR